MRTAEDSEPVRRSTALATRAHFFRFAGVLAFLVWRLAPPDFQGISGLGY